MSDPKMDRLRAVPLFARCDNKTIEHLMSIVDTADVKEGTQLFKEGRWEHYAYVIESGTAEVSVNGSVVAEIPAGEIVGEIGLLVAGPASATVVAKTPMSVMTIPREQFEAVLNEAPGLALAIAKELAQRLHDMDERASQ